MQLEHKHHKKTPPSSEIILLCDSITSPANIGAIFRLADAFGVKEIIFGGAFPDLSSSRLRKTARNTERTVSYGHSDDLIATINTLSNDGYSSLALEITSKSKPVQHIKKLEKSILIIGNERHGINKEILQISEYHAHIEMYGSNSSMNVAQATGIALYELRRV